MTTQNRNVSVRVTLGGRVDRSLGAAFDEAQGELSQTQDQIQDPPNTPNTCLLYTSPSPRDS